MVMNGVTYLIHLIQEVKGFGEYCVQTTWLERNDIGTVAHIKHR